MNSRAFAHLRRDKSLSFVSHPAISINEISSDT